MEFTQGRKQEDLVHHFLPTVSPTCPSSSSSFHLHWTDGSEPPPSTATEPANKVEKEHMFEKVVTPSDVGKLNRLVIPKQHAEKYFPLDASHDKGLLLNFEDRNGKPWRFRYSYWNSSQSYVMTKGWSRFVKEKRLDAGDTVSFGRGVGETAHDRLFIDWKRRPDPHFDQPASLRIPRFAYHPSASLHSYLPFPRSSPAPWPPGRLFAPQTTAHPAANCFYFRSPNPGLQPGLGLPTPMVLDSFPVARGKAASAPKRLRLFGVNLEQQREAGDDADADPAGRLQLQLRAPLPDLRLGCSGGVRSSSSSSSSGGGKAGHTINSLSLDLDM